MKWENSVHVQKHCDNTSGFKGVFKKEKRWVAKIRVKGKYFHLGTFLTKKDAAVAYNNAALEHFGKFARLNEIN